jgi:DNA invertase Pin-like site-specific DNA recombinase
MSTRNTRIKNIALYARISIAATPPKKTGQAERDAKRHADWKHHHRDAENQLRQLRDFARKQGWKIVHEYVDQDSGSKSNRPQLTQMLADASQRKFDLLLFWSLDRLSREGATKTFGYLERLNSSGVEWWSMQEEYLRSLGPFAEAVLAILAVIAKQERIRISERTRAGMDRARAEGKHVGRPGKIVDRFKVRDHYAASQSQRATGKHFGISAPLVGRILKAVA